MSSLALLRLSSAIVLPYFSFFFFNDASPTEIYTLSLHDALPIWPAARSSPAQPCPGLTAGEGRGRQEDARQDRKSTRLNSSHANISYAVFCLKKKKKNR